MENVSKKTKHHGYDFSINVHSAFLINFLSLKGQHVYFLNKSSAKQFYIENGLNIESSWHVLWPINLKSVSYEITPGIQWGVDGKTKFWQLDITQPLYMNRHAFEKKYQHFPVVGISYGFGF